MTKKRLFNKIDSFFVNIFFNRNKFLYLIIYAIISLSIIKWKFDKITHKFFMSVVGGLFFLMIGMLGVKDKKLHARTVQLSKKDSTICGYISLFISILFLFLLYFEVYFLS